MIEYDPFAEEVLENPYPIYARLRERDPVHYMKRWDGWAISKFRDIWDLSSNRALSTAKGTTASQVLTKTQPVTPMLNVMDPPEHTRLRIALRSHFAPSAVRALEPEMRSILADAFEKVEAEGGCDVIDDIAARLSVKVTCKAVGIPLEDGDHLADLVWRFFAREPGVEGMTSMGLAAAQELSDYFVSLARRRRASAARRGDVVDLFCFSGWGHDGERLPEEAVASHLSMLIIGGSETFPKTFANAVLRLWEHPAQRAVCVADPARIPDAYQEALRYDMPTQFLCRTVKEEVRIRDTVLRPGQPVLFLYASANRDGGEFPFPDRFDIDRRARRILSFGAGLHACIGLHVARMEGRVCLEELLLRYPEYEVDLDSAERLRTEFVQGFTKLPIRFGME